MTHLRSVLLLIVFLLIATIIQVTPTTSGSQFLSFDQQIIINSDGSITPSNAPITTNDNITYVLTSDVAFSYLDYLDGYLRVERNNITINGAGYAIQGQQDASVGIRLRNVNSTAQYNVTIANMTIAKFGMGIWVSGSNNNIIDNNIIDNIHAGIDFGNGKNNLVARNTFARNLNGVGVGPSPGPANISIVNNTFTDNSRGIIISRSLVTVIGNTISNSLGDGISVFESFDGLGSNITQNRIDYNDIGIWSFSSKNSITNNSFTANRNIAIRIFGGDPPLYIDPSSLVGCQSYVAFNIISGNYITRYGIQLERVAYNNNITANNIDRTTAGILLKFGATYNSITNNNLVKNTYGVFFSLELANDDPIMQSYPVVNNTFYHNNFIDNSKQVSQDQKANASNIWDNNYPSGGNYWNNYLGVDSDGEGIGDSAYIIDQNNTDRYPLMNSFGAVAYPPEPFPTPTPPVASPNPTPSPTASSTSQPSPTASPTKTPPPATPRPTITATPNPTTFNSTLHVKTSAGTTVNLEITGNLTKFQISNIVLTTTPASNLTILSFSVDGQSGTVGFSNITIPKSAVPTGTAPTIYIDNQPAQTQGYTQDSNNYYVWYTTHFSSHQISIIFNMLVSPSPTASNSGSQGQSSLPEVVYGLVAAVAVVIVVVIVLRVITKGRRAKTGQSK